MDSFITVQYMIPFIRKGRHHEVLNHSFNIFPNLLNFWWFVHKLYPFWPKTVWTGTSTWTPKIFQTNYIQLNTALVLLYKSHKNIWMNWMLAILWKYIMNILQKCRKIKRIKNSIKVQNKKIHNAARCMNGSNRKVYVYILLSQENYVKLAIYWAVWWILWNYASNSFAVNWIPALYFFLSLIFGKLPVA